MILTRGSGWRPRLRYNARVSFAIRCFEKTDFETLWRIDQDCFDPQLAYSRPELAFYMRRPSSFTLVAEANVAAQAANAELENDELENNELENDEHGNDGHGAACEKIVGFIVAEKRRHTGHIITIDVIAEARRSGVGSALLAAAESRLRESGALAVELETAVNNDAAIRFYKEKGYFVERTVRGYYSNKLDALVMGKSFTEDR